MVIHHTVFFKLKHPAGSTPEKAFMAAAKKLENIPGVVNFQCLKQTSRKNNFDFGLSMEFSNQDLYDQYNNHPDHITFVQNLFVKEVEDFLEIDYEVMG